MKYILVLCLLYMTGHKITVYVSGSTVGLSLEQSLPSITTAGKNPTLRCIMRGSNISSHVLSWYHQKPSNDIQFLVSHRDKSRPTYAEGIVERFIPGIEESLNAFTLTIGNVEKRDEGLYYCAVWFSNRYIFGEGTEIKVQELQYIHRPTMTLFEPSPLEIQFRHTATLLCHVERYFPKSLRIKWFLSKETPVESLNFPAIQNADNTFRQTSALTISAKLWKKGVKITCFLEHESGMQSISTQSTKQHSGLTQKECEPKNLTAEELELSKNETGEMTSEISPDYWKILSVAFVVYSALLVISVFYGILLLLCLIQRKSCNSKDVDVSKQSRVSDNDLPNAEQDEHYPSMKTNQLTCELKFIYEDS